MGELSYTQCRYVRRNDERCTAEAMDTSPDALVVICSKHAAAVMQLINERLTARSAT